MKEKFANWLKSLPKRYFIDAFTGMAQGLFVTLIAGTIIKTIGVEIIGDNVVGNYFKNIGIIASVLMGAGIGAGIAYYLKANKLVIFAAIVAGFMGAYSEFVVADKGALSTMMTKISLGVPGNPISAYVCALLATEVGSLVQGKTKLDILLVPLTCICCAFIGLYVSVPFVFLIQKLAQGIEYATGITPFFMGIIIAVVMGLLLTLPTSSAAIWTAIALGNTSETMLIAGGAAVVGCAAHMVGFAVMSFKENGVGGLISQGLGTSMLQIPNVMKKPVLFVPPVVASAICGPLATCLFKLKCNASGGGMGTSGLVGVFGVLAVDNDVMAWIGIILLMFVIPAVVCWLLGSIMRKKGIIQDGDLKI